ncbi:MAG: class II aldolase/adducin family protein [Clostridia bacterium]|nr:class II aldolase/adducin family protein [Clostridia bacterium]
MDQILFVKEKIIQIGKEILHSGLTVGTWGNISSRVPGEDLVAITPSGLDYTLLEPADIVLLDLEGTIVSGCRRPSIEVPLHLAIYQARKDVHSVVHTHSVYATAFAAARQALPPALEDLVQMVGGAVRVSDYALPGSKKLGANAVKALEGRQAVLLANHGLLGVGRNLEEALKVCQVVEKAAQITIMARLLGGVVELSPGDIHRMRQFYLHHYGQK